jgi:small subunit ribosomal protein S16
VAVKIRLKRLGKIRAPYYRIVVADSRTKRDGRVIEEIGQYHPTEHPSVIKVDSARAQYWLGVGAQPTEQVAALLKLTGDWGRFKGDAKAENRVEVKGEKAAFQPDAKKTPVVRPKSEVKDAEKAARADAEADAERVDEADSTTTVEHETPQQVDNS